MIYDSVYKSLKVIFEQILNFTYAVKNFFMKLHLSSNQVAQLTKLMGTLFLDYSKEFTTC